MESYFWIRQFPLSSPSTSVTALRNLRFSSSLEAAICSDINMPSVMALSRPPPSPRSAGPRHSGRLISKRTTRLAFSSTLSPMIKLRSFNLYYFLMFSLGRLIWITCTAVVIVKIAITGKLQAKFEKVHCFLFLFIVNSYAPLTHTQNLRKSRNLSPSTGSQPMSGYPRLTRSWLVAWPHLDRYTATLSKSCSLRANANSLLSIRDE